MPRLNLSKVILSPRLAQAFTVHRKSGAWAAGRFESAETALPFYGTITVAAVEDLEQIPEADRVKGMMCFYSPQEMFVTRNDPDPGTSDEIEWRGDRYRVFQVSPHIDYGYYKAIGARMAGD